jgi:hypothetical protein
MMEHYSDILPNCQRCTAMRAFGNMCTLSGIVLLLGKHVIANFSLYCTMYTGLYLLQLVAREEDEFAMPFT